MKKEIFNLPHLVLYSKGWYKRTYIEDKEKTIYDDLRIIMNMDGYYGDVMTRNDIVQVILQHIELLPKLHNNSLSSFINGINPKETWKYGYYTKGNIPSILIKEEDDLPEYDYFTAVIFYCLSLLSSLEVKNLEIKLPKPDYSKGLEMPNNRKN